MSLTPLLFCESAKWFVTPLIKSTESFKCTDGFSMPAYVTRPTTGKYPGLIFIFEIFGVTAEMKRVADDFAAAGYAVMMPNLFSRGSWFSCVRKFMNDLKAGEGRSVDDCIDARNWLSPASSLIPRNRRHRVLSEGGAFALILSKTGHFRVAAPFYGHSPDNLEGACPIIASYGALDKPTRPEFER